MTDFSLWNTKDDIRRYVHAALFHSIKIRLLRSKRAPYKYFLVFSEEIRYQVYQIRMIALRDEQNEIANLQNASSVL